MDINSAADELYSLLPEEFTAARNAREKEAKSTGDKQLATAIHDLRKPSTGGVAGQPACPRALRRGPVVS